MNKTNTKKGFVIPLVIAIIVVLVAGGYMYQRWQNKVELIAPVDMNKDQYKSVNNSTTADWKTYTNTQYSFFLKYPKDFTVSEKQDRILINSIDTYNQWGVTIVPSSQTVLPNKPTLGPCSGSEMGCPGIVSYNILIDGAEGRLDYVAGDGGISEAKAYFLHTGKLYTFYSNTSMSGKTMGDIFKTTISSINFTN